MALNKEYFETINERMNSYFAVYPTGLVTLTIRTTWGEEFNALRFLERTDEWLMFAYYSNKKSVELNEKIKERTGESTAYPAISLPYDAILSVEFNPGAIKENKLGFTPPK